MKKVVFFGLGAVGSVIACCLYELHKHRTNNKKIKFVFIVRDEKETRNHLFRAPHVLKSSQFLTLKNFDILFQNPQKYTRQLSNTDIFINAAIPRFNESILRLALEFNACYCDLASDMYNSRTLKTLQFPQQDFHKRLQEKKVFGLINVGISPGITNFLIGERLKDLNKISNLKKIKAINLYLLENIESNRVVFSWSPATALEELEQKPRYFKNEKLITVEPFSNSQIYEFYNFPRKVMQYPIYQEEILSFHSSYPYIKSLRVSTGGSEVELIKNLFQLNLLSKRDIICVKKNISVEQIVRMVLPGMQSPQTIAKMLKTKIIKSANFTAIAEIILEMKKKYREKPVLITEAIGLSFNQYPSLLGTQFSGATYISYPTGVGAAILLFYTYQCWKKDAQKFSGVIKAEELPEKMGNNIVHEIKSELSLRMIEFFSGTHSFLDTAK